MPRDRELIDCFVYSRSFLHDHWLIQIDSFGGLVLLED